ncbi:MAG: FAD-dependent oxidoreductase [Syntrophobacteraceae bacterium]|jgi:NADPH-dependent 2,4-dienoyl-CoA reductase/sulfur reductase-like enzyme/rhodanese-related sulfurtransferase|nr:FAD-dependent oxidoreductase [Syntrophobacteraceae bacterium]
MKNGKRLLIVGGVAGGASCAARARRLSEEIEIVLLDRGPHVSFASCGLPYHVGRVIPKEASLLVATPEVFEKRFNIRVCLGTEAVRIDRVDRRLEVKDLGTGETRHEPYDWLVLSPGAHPVKPPVPGLDLPGVFTLRTIPDTRRIKGWIADRMARRAVVVGGGFIGLEMAENLVRLGLEVTVVEMQPHVMPVLDPEIAVALHEELSRHNVRLRLNEALAGFEEADGGRLGVKLASGAEEEADLAILAVGVRPETGLAREAGLELGDLGGIRVDEGMRTSDPRIWALGDAVEVRDAVTGRWTLLPLAGPANRQGRVAADVILGRDARFRGVQGTAVVGVFSLTVASTGSSEKALRRRGLWDGPDRLEKVYLHPGHHAGYYPGASPITMKLIFSKESGRIVGAQAIGKEGVEKRIDVIAMAIQKGGTVFDLEEAELCYAPQFGSAKDPVNMAGMIAANVVRGDAGVFHWDELEGSGAFIVDVRDPAELKGGRIEGSVNIPLSDIRSRMSELPRDREIWTYCFVGQRSYYAARILAQQGLAVRSLSGGYKVYTLGKALLRT